MKVHRVIHQDVEAAGFRDELLHRVEHRLAIRDVADKWRAGGFARAGLSALGVHIDDGDACAFLRQRERDGAPDARASAGDERGLALKHGLIVLVALKC